MRSLLVSGNSSGNSYLRTVAFSLIHVPFQKKKIPIRVVCPLGGGQTPFISQYDFSEVTIFPPPKQQTRFFLPTVRGMSDNMVDKIVVLRMNKNFMKFMNLNYPWILKHRFPTFGTVISVSDNEQDDVEMDYE